MSYNTDDRDAYFFDRNAEQETPTAFFMGRPLHRCLFPGCSSEPHPLSDTLECEHHTLQSYIRDGAEGGVDEFIAEQMERWTRIAGAR